MEASTYAILLAGEGIRGVGCGCGWCVEARTDTWSRTVLGGSLRVSVRIKAEQVLYINGRVSMRTETTVRHASSLVMVVLVFALVPQSATSCAYICHSGG
jgi:hypothetical protein